MNGELGATITGLQNQIVNPLITLIALAAFVYFLWGVFLFVRSKATGGKDTDDGKRHMVYGIIGLAIIFGARAIIALLFDVVDTF